MTLPKNKGSSSYYSLFMLKEREKILELVKESVGSKSELSTFAKAPGDKTAKSKKANISKQFELKRPKSTLISGTIPNTTPATSTLSTETDPRHSSQTETKPTPSQTIETRVKPSPWTSGNVAKPLANDGLTGTLSVFIYIMVLACYLCYYFYGY